MTPSNQFAIIPARAVPYQFSDKHFTSGTDVIAASQAARARLLGAKPTVKAASQRSWSYAPAPLPVRQELVDEPIVLPMPDQLWRAIAEATAKRHCIPFLEIIGPTRERHVVLARQEAMYLVTEQLGMSSCEVGRRFGGRNHSTVHYSLKMYRKRIAGVLTHG